MVKKLELGNPHKRQNYITVDINPIEADVIKDEAIHFLSTTPDHYEVIESYNLLEHLPNPGMFLELCHGKLTEGGKCIVVTDNAEWLPFYFPVLHALGVGAHQSNYYRYIGNSKGATVTVHYMVFSPLNLRNLLTYAGFKKIKVRRTTFGARLLGEGLKE